MSIHGSWRRQQKEKEALQLVVRGWRAPNRMLAVQFGTDVSEAKVCKVHAAP